MKTAFQTDYMPIVLSPKADPASPAVEMLSSKERLVYTPAQRRLVKAARSAFRGNQAVPAHMPRHLPMTSLTSTDRPAAKNLLTSPSEMPRSSTVRLVEIAELLGVSNQRVHQIAAERDFPAPVSEEQDAVVHQCSRMYLDGLG
jgi:predicted DNA-binding transcriptional regulator AlpA